MSSDLLDGSETQTCNLVNWRAFSLAYYDQIIQVMRVLGVPNAQIEDLAHGFLVKASDRDFLGRYHAFRTREQSEGRSARFRHYLYRSLQHFVIDTRRASGTRLNSAASLGDSEFLEAPPVPSLDPDAVHALVVLNQALQALHHHCERTGKPHVWVVFEELLLADEFRGRRGKTREELVRHLGFASVNSVDSALTTAKRAFRRFVQEVVPLWPGENFGTKEHFNEWMEALRHSNASQFGLLHLAYRVEPHVEGPAETDSMALVMPSPADLADAPPDDDDLSLLLSFRLELPLTQWLDASELVAFLPTLIPTGSRSPGSRLRAERSWSLLSLINPTPEETLILAGGNAVGLLDRLKSIHKLLHRQNQGVPGESFAELFYTVICVLGLVRYNAVLFSIGTARLAVNARWFLSRPWLDDRLRPLLQEGLNAIARAHERENGDSSPADEPRS